MIFVRRKACCPAGNRDRGFGWIFGKRDLYLR